MGQYPRRNNPENEMPREFCGGTELIKGTLCPTVGLGQSKPVTVMRFHASEKCALERKGSEGILDHGCSHKDSLTKHQGELLGS